MEYYGGLFYAFGGEPFWYVDELDFGPVVDLVLGDVVKLLVDNLDAAVVSVFHIEAESLGDGGDRLAALTFNLDKSWHPWPGIDVDLDTFVDPGFAQGFLDGLWLVAGGVEEIDCILIVVYRQTDFLHALEATLLEMLD